MVRILLIFIDTLDYAFCAYGMIAVLVAPIFSIPNDKTPVVQYIKKGEMIYIHPEESHLDTYATKNYKKSPDEFELKDEDLFLNKKTIYKKSCRFMFG